jgi:hypothetical protein
MPDLTFMRFRKNPQSTGMLMSRSSLAYMEKNWSKIRMESHPENPLMPSVSDSAMILRHSLEVSAFRSSSWSQLGQA